MKTLNRPMFRYGGPIKEGVMNGIREPKKHGGSMGEPQATYGVGNNMNRDASGREKHALFLPALYAAGAAGLRMAARPFGKYVAKQFARPDRLSKTGKIIKSQVGKGGGIGPSTYLKTGKPGEGIKTFNPNAVGRYFRDSPEAGVITGAGGKITRGIYNTGRYAVKSPLTVASVAGFGGKKLYDKLKGAPNKDNDGDGISDINQKKSKIGMPENLTLGGGQNYEGDSGKELTDAEREQIEADNRMKQMDRYREIIDIKGMSKDAAYKSLIDASKIIQEGGNLKKSLKDGSLISKVTAAASKRFDKVNDTENALRSLVVKGEIDNELNKVDKDLKRRALEGQIKVNEKALAGLTTGEMIQKILGRAQGEYPKGDALRQIISINNPQLNAKVLPTGDMPTGSDALEYATTMINTRNNDETTPDYPEGVYIIKDRVIQVIDGQVIPVPINKL